MRRRFQNLAKILDCECNHGPHTAGACPKCNCGQSSVVRIKGMAIENDKDGGRGFRSRRVLDYTKIT